ncbi:unnamed protein product [Mycena citricolor]|uniref:DNA-binding protein RAP1 n=1 Tax=Mycena citricolor TaxID=2018698 RepID=A0AAD2HQ75_9AGAR|nr:unnamed protein product [Mycena citricolor]
MADQPNLIFHDVKFFIQKDLPEDVQAHLTETIQSLGGRVESKVPLHGFLLVQPGSPEGGRLYACWKSADRPERYFVPYTYVDACKVANVRLKQIFIENGEAIQMHIHASIANLNVRSALSQRIMHSGGEPNATAEAARVILADPDTEVFQHLVKTYQGMPDKYIESYLWVKKCVEREAVIYTPLVYKNPGGRRPGEEYAFLPFQHAGMLILDRRTQFTEEDEENLAKWIAAKIPFKEIGGRTGNRLYQQLCEMSHEPDYMWVTRHTWQSWRERYKKNSARLDTLIAAIVAQTKPTQGEKGQYGYVRQAEEKPKKPRKKRVKNQEPPPIQPDEAFLLANGDPGLFQPPIAPLPDLNMAVGLAGHMHIPGLMYDVAPVGPAPLPAARTEEEMEDDEVEWAVRVGHSPPPAWAAKRRSSQEAHDPNAAKRQKMGEAQLMGRDMHVVDQAIHDIAAEYAFTIHEVQVYYDRCGEMERTRNRFKGMRELLTDRFPMDA